MWILEILDNENLEVTKRYFLNNVKNSNLIIRIGRSVENDIIFSSDRSISRKHSEISFKKEEEEGQQQEQIKEEKVYLKDLKSTIGTFLNGEKIQSNQEITLCSGDLIKFGNENTIVRILQFKFKFCPTRLEKIEKERLKTMISNIDGEIVKNVESCNHVLCNRFSATVKTLTAIVLQKPIVSLHWVESFASSSSSSSSFRSIEIPDVKE